MEDRPKYEKKSAVSVIIHSFFVVPFIIAIFAVIIFLIARIMTAEPNTARDYLEDVKIGGTTKRWQGAFDLSKILSKPSCPHKHPFCCSCIAVAVKLIHIFVVVHVCIVAWLHVYICACFACWQFCIFHVRICEVLYFAFL